MVEKQMKQEKTLQQNVELKSFTSTNWEDKYKTSKPTQIPFGNHFSSPFS